MKGWILTGALFLLNSHPLENTDDASSLFPMAQPTEQRNDKERVPNIFQSRLAATCHCCGTREQSESDEPCEEPRATAVSGIIPLAQRKMDIFVFH